MCLPHFSSISTYNCLCITIYGRIELFHGKKPVSLVFQFNRRHFQVVMCKSGTTVLSLEVEFNVEVELLSNVSHDFQHTAGHVQTHKFFYLLFKRTTITVTSLVLSENYPYPQNYFSPSLWIKISSARVICFISSTKPGQRKNTLVYFCSPNKCQALLKAQD